MSFDCLFNYPFVFRLAHKDDEFHRKLRLREFFNDNNTVDTHLVKNNSYFVPQKGRNEALDTYIETTKTISSSISTLHKDQVKHNISFNERKAFFSLRNDTNIIIKEADKGGGIVVMNRNYHQKKILDMLYNNSYYQQIPDMSSQKIFTKIKELFKSSKNISKKEKEDLLNFDYKDRKSTRLNSSH